MAGDGSVIIVSGCLSCSIQYLSDGKTKAAMLVMCVNICHCIQSSGGWMWVWFYPTLRKTHIHTLQPTTPPTPYHKPAEQPRQHKKWGHVLYFFIEVFNNSFSRVLIVSALCLDIFPPTPLPAHPSLSLCLACCQAWGFWKWISIHLVEALPLGAF